MFLITNNSFDMLILFWINLYVDIHGEDLIGYMVDDDQIVKSRDDALSGRIYVDHEEEDDIIKLKSKDDSHLCT